MKDLDALNEKQIGAEKQIGLGTQCNDVIVASVSFVLSNGMETS